MPIETAICRVQLADLQLLEKNAHYMDPDEFARLVNNIKNDGVLTSLPVVYRGTVLSGNHRTQAAIKAGLVESDVIEIVSEVTAPRRKRRGFPLLRPLLPNWQIYAGLHG